MGVFLYDIAGLLGPTVASAIAFALFIALPIFYALTSGGRHSLRAGGEIAPHAIRHDAKQKGPGSPGPLQN